MNKLRLILGDQLNINHSWFKENNHLVTYDESLMKQLKIFYKDLIEKI